MLSSARGCIINQGEPSPNAGLRWGALSKLRRPLKAFIMSKTQTLASAFGTIAKTLAAKTVGKEVAVVKTRRAKDNAQVATPATQDDSNNEQRLLNREMRKFARGLKAMGVRRLRFMPFAEISGGAAFRAAGKTQDRVAELTNLYAAEGSLKSVKAGEDATVIRLNYSRTSRVEVFNKGVVFHA